MSEALPDPSLSIFPNRTVFYTVVHPERDTDHSVIEVPVGEIDEIKDPNIRRALWDKFLFEESQSDSVISIMAKSDGSFSHSFASPRKLLGVTLTADGVIKNDDLHTYWESKAQEKATQQAKNAGWIARLLKRQR